MPANAKIGLFAFSNDGVGNPVAAFDCFTLTGEGAGGGGGGGTPSGPSYDDQFDDATLDKTRWNAIVRDTPAEYELAGGEFTLTLEPGRHLHGRHQPAAEQLHPAGRVARRRGLGDRDEDHRLHDNGGYAQGGLMAYVNGDNYVKFDAISDPDDTRFNRIELRSEVAGAIQDPQVNANLTAAQAAGPIWLRLTKAGQQLHGRVLVRRRGLDGVPGRRGDEPDGRAGLRHLRLRAAGVGSARPCRSTTSSSTGPTRATASSATAPVTRSPVPRSTRSAGTRSPTTTRRSTRSTTATWSSPRPPARSTRPAPVAARCCCRRPTTPGPTTSSRPS